MISVWAVNYLEVRLMLKYTDSIKNVIFPGLSRKLM